MPLSFPLASLFNNEFFTTKQFFLVGRQDWSQKASGPIIVRDYGMPLWVASFTTATISHDDCIDVEARLMALDGMARKFYAWDTRRPYPRAYPTGNFTDSGTVQSTPSNVNQIALTGLPSGFQISVGDRFSIDHGDGGMSLYVACEDVTATGGNTGDFAVRPPVHPNVSPGDSVEFKKPKAIFTLTEEQPQFNDAGQVLGTVSFKAIQDID